MFNFRIFITFSLLFLGIRYSFAQKNTHKPNTSEKVVASAEIENPGAEDLFQNKYRGIETTWFYSLEDALQHSEEVYKLDLSNKDLSSLPGSVGKLKNLVLLNLHNNKLSELPSELFFLTHLIELDLGDNKFSVVPKQICSLKNLEVLRLNGNDISTVGSELNCLNGLEMLFLQSNHIEYVSADIGTLKNLRYLYLYNNELTKIPDEISHLKNLQVLLLQNNKLTQVPSNMDKLTKLGYYSDAGNINIHDRKAPFYNTVVSNYNSYYTIASAGQTGNDEGAVETVANNNGAITLGRHKTYIKNGETRSIGKYGEDLYQEFGNASPEAKQEMEKYMKKAKRTTTFCLFSPFIYPVTIFNLVSKKQTLKKAVMLYNQSSGNIFSPPAIRQRTDSPGRTADKSAPDASYYGKDASMQDNYENKDSFYTKAAIGGAVGAVGVYEGVKHASQVKSAFNSVRGVLNVLNKIIRF